MRLRSLQLKNYKGFEDETVSLDRPLTVLVGPNGAGKSSVFDALSILLSDEMLNHLVIGDTFVALAPDRIDIRQGATSASIEAHVVVAGVAYPLAISTVIDQRTDLLDIRERPYGNTRLSAALSTAQELPLFFPYSASRRVERNWKQPLDTNGKRAQRVGKWTDALIDAATGDIGFEPFFRWFRKREDIENEAKVALKDLSFEDPQLRCVRSAIRTMLPGYDNLRLQREPLHIVLSKSNKVLHLDSLSDGEKGLIAMTADIASRLAIAYPNMPDALKAEAVIAIDELDQHLHPAWQRTVAGRLRSTFPNCQFIVTTHSPQILSEVPTESIVMLRDFKVEPLPAPTHGRDTNAILSEVLGVPERPLLQSEQLAKISRLIDEDRLEDAQRELEELAKLLTDRDGEVIRLRTMLEFLGETA